MKVDVRRVSELRQGFGHIMNTTDLEREYLQEMLDLFQTRVSTELNRFVRKVTAWGSVGLAWTVIVGLYGMNFTHMPELSWTWGYPAVLAVMARGRHHPRGLLPQARLAVTRQQPGRPTRSRVGLANLWIDPTPTRILLGQRPPIPNKTVKVVPGPRTAVTICSPNAATCAVIRRTSLIRPARAAEWPPMTSRARDPAQQHRRGGGAAAATSPCFTAGNPSIDAYQGDRSPPCAMVIVGVRAGGREYR